MERISATVVTLLTPVVVLSACAGHTNTAVHSAISTRPLVSSRASATAASTAETAAFSAYAAMWRDVEKASLTANYRSPLLEQHASGAALSLLVQGVHDLQLQHLITRGAPVLHPTVTAIAPTAAPALAKIRDCFDDTHWLNYKASGGLQNKIPGGHRLITASLLLSGGAWKVTQLNVGAEGTC